MGTASIHFKLQIQTEEFTLSFIAMEYMPKTQWLFRFMALWPPEYKDRTFKVRQYLNITLVVYNTIGIGAYPLVTMNDPKIPTSFKLDNLLKTICVLIFTYYYLCTFYLRNEFMILYEHLKNFGGFGKPPNYERVSKVLDIVTVLLCIYCTIVSFSFGFIPLFQFRECITYNQVHNTTIMCGYALSMKYPYDLGDGWFYYLHIFVQFYCGTTMSVKGVVFFGLIVGTSEGMISRLNHLMSMLKDVYSDDDFLNQKKRLRNCIMYHIHILNLAETYNTNVAILTMPCLILYNVIIGTSILVLLNIKTGLSFATTVGWIASLLFGCTCGERLINTSIRVGEVAYELQWYTDTRLREDLQFMILRSQKPIRLECGELGELSFLTFKKIMQGAYTYATMKSGFGN